MGKAASWVSAKNSECFKLKIYKFTISYKNDNKTNFNNALLLTIINIEEYELISTSTFCKNI